MKNFGADAGAPTHRLDDRRFSSSWHRLYWLVTAMSVAVFSQPAKAVDEIQVYNANIAAPGQFTIQQHLNYGMRGLVIEPSKPDHRGFDWSRRTLGAKVYAKGGE